MKPIRSSKRLITAYARANKGRVRSIESISGAKERAEKSVVSVSRVKESGCPWKNRMLTTRYPKFETAAQSAYRIIPIPRCSTRRRRDRKLVAYASGIAYRVRVPSVPEETRSNSMVSGMIIGSAPGKPERSVHTTTLEMRMSGAETDGARTSKKENSKNTSARMNKDLRKNIFISDIREYR